MNGMHKMLAMPDVTRTNQRRVILPAAGTIPAIIPGVCPDGSFGTGSGSTCQQIEFGGDCWAYCQTASGYEGLARQYRCELTGDVLELKSVVADLTCATVTATVTLTTTVIGRRLASLDPCSSTSVTQVSDTSGSCVLWVLWVLLFSRSNDKKLPYMTRKLNHNMIAHQVYLQNFSWIGE